MKKRIIRLAFTIVGAAIGFYYLPLLWAAIGFKLATSLLAIVDMVIGAVLFFLLSLSLADWAANLMKRTEQALANGGVVEKEGSIHASNVKVIAKKEDNNK